MPAGLTAAAAMQACVYAGSGLRPAAGVVGDPTLFTSCTADIGQGCVRGISVGSTGGPRWSRCSR